MAVVEAIAFQVAERGKLVEKGDQAASILAVNVLVGEHETGGAKIAPDSLLGVAALGSEEELSGGGGGEEVGVGGEEALDEVGALDDQRLVLVVIQIQTDVNQLRFDVVSVGEDGVEELESFIRDAMVVEVEVGAE